MKKILVLLAVLAITVIVAAACGDDEGDPVSDFVSSGGPGISIGEALTSNLIGPLLVNGLLHVQNGQVRLCETLAVSFPPQCAGKFLVVIGSDLMTMEGLTSEGSITWSNQPVQVLGTVEGEVLTVGQTPSDSGASIEEDY